MQDNNFGDKIARDIFLELDRAYGQGWEAANRRKLDKWWPVSGRFVPENLEIAVGCILTQNTSWRNAEKAVANMIDAGLTDAGKISRCSIEKMQKAARPAGFYKQKAESIRNLCKFISGFGGDFFKDIRRQDLLELKGIGNETADSILLFACNRPEFVIDAYTRRIFSRHGLIGKNEKYSSAKNFFGSRLKKSAENYRVCHALIVEHAKAVCRKEPLCGKCPLAGKCRKLI